MYILKDKNGLYVSRMKTMNVISPSIPCQKRLDKRWSEIPSNHTILVDFEIKDGAMKFSCAEDAEDARIAIGAKCKIELELEAIK